MVWTGVGSAGVGGGLDFLGGLLQRSDTKAAQKKAFKYTRRIMQNQVQWRVGDLKAAGINPVLAAGMGLGGGGGPAGPGAGQFQNVASGVASSARSAVEARKQAEILNSVAQQEKEKVFNIEADTDLKVWQRNLNIDQAALTRTNAKHGKADLVRAEEDAAFYRTPIGKNFRWIERAIGSVTGARGMVRRRRK